VKRVLLGCEESFEKGTPDGKNHFCHNIRLNVGYFIDFDARNKIYINTAFAGFVQFLHFICWDKYKYFLGRVRPV